MPGRYHRDALISTLICAGLVLVGIVRMLSYSQTNPIAEALRESALGFLAYQPDTPWSVRFFKLIATPVLISVIYFVFRVLNRAHRVKTPGYEAPDRTIDFTSPWLRLLLIGVASAHWIPLEYMKFTRDDFYPSSPHEVLWINVVVLFLSAVVSFIGMRRLSFTPLFRDRP